MKQAATSLDVFPTLMSSTPLFGIAKRRRPDRAQRASSSICWATTTKQITCRSLLRAPIDRSRLRGSSSHLRTSSHPYLPAASTSSVFSLTVPNMPKASLELILVDTVLLYTFRIHRNQKNEQKKPKNASKGNRTPVSC